MTSTFLVSVDHGSDTDLLGIADELLQSFQSAPFEVLTVTPWSHPTLGQQSPTPPVAPAN